MPTSTIKKGGSFRLHVTFSPSDTNYRFYLPVGTKIDFLYLVNTGSTPLTLSTFDLVNQSAVPTPETVFSSSLPSLSSIAQDRFIELHPYLRRQLLSYGTSGQIEIEMISNITSGSIDNILLIFGLSTIY